MINESYLINEKDIYYNKDKFDNGEINLCFITGLSGSGKSTMGRNMQNDNIEHYELDDIVFIKERFTMNNLKEYGDLIYSYFNGPGKRFYVTYDEIVKNNVPGSKYEDIMYPEFVHYAMKYAKLHKDRKYVIEGVWLFCKDDNNKPWFYPEEFRDYAFYIKGTSMLISKYRAAKRDAKEDNSNKKEENKAFRNNFFKKNWKYYFLDEKAIKKFRDYFKKLEKSFINESKDISKLDDKFSKKKIDFNYKIFDINRNKREALKYISKEWYYDGKDCEIIFDTDNDKVCGYIYVKNKNGHIAPLRVYDNYKGYGFSEILLKDAIEKFKGYKLDVFSDNQVAIRLYKKFGFVIIEKREYKDGDIVYIMKLKSKLSKNDKILNEEK